MTVLSNPQALAAVASNRSVLSKQICELRSAIPSTTGSFYHLAQCNGSTQTDRLLSICALPLSAMDVPEWVELIPAGKFSGVDGRGPFENDDPDSVVAASRAKMPQVGLVLDYDHSTDLAAPEGRPAPAAGWLKQFKVENGAIFARVEWTTDGAEAVKEKKYRYISPVFEHAKDGKVERILRAALTNNPALINLPALASADHRLKPVATEEPYGVVTMASKPGEKPKLSEVMASLEEAYPDASPQKLMKAAACLLGEDGDDDSEDDAAAQAEDGDPYESEQMAARHADEMSRCSTDEERAATLARHEAEKAQMAETTDRNRGLELKPHTGEARSEKSLTSAIAKHPMVVRMASEINQMRAAQAKACATEKVDAAIREGRLVPSQREWAIAYCSSDAEGFDRFIGAQPKILQAGPDGTFTGRLGEAPQDALTQKELSVCENLGVTPEKFAAAKKARLSHNVTLE
jgi:phage I-like protein